MKQRSRREKRRTGLVMLAPGEEFPSFRAFVEAQPRTLTQAWIARQMKLTPSMFSEFLHERRPMSSRTALRLSTQFQISLKGLLQPEWRRRRAG